MEKCRIIGQIEVSKMQGNFHLAAGRTSMQKHGSHKHHVHSLNLKDAQKYNVSHKINRLEFGSPYPGLANPLNNWNYLNKKENGLEAVTYTITIVPTEYTQLGYAPVTANQYTVRDDSKKVVLSPHSNDLPGVFFKYDYSPYRIDYKEQEVPFTHFLTRLCAVIGGVFVVTGIVYNGIIAVYEKTTGKKVTSSLLL